MPDLSLPKIAISLSSFLFISILSIHQSTYLSIETYNRNKGFVILLHIRMRRREEEEEVHLGNKWGLDSLKGSKRERERGKMVKAKEG